MGRVNRAFGSITEKIAYRLVLLLTCLRVSMPLVIYQRRWKVPVRGRVGLMYFFRHGRRRTWKSALFEKVPMDAGECFIDVGANAGQTLMEFRSAHRDTPYYGFDPNPQAISYVQELIDLNRIRNAVVFCCGLSDHSGLTYLNLHPRLAGDPGATLIDDLRPDRPTRRCGAAIMALDTVLEQTRPTRIKLVKIDVEGAELFVLRGMTRILETDRPLILCEVLFADRNADPAKTYERNREVMSLLGKFGYSAFRILKDSEFQSRLSFERTAEFEERTWHEDVAALCDYLFVPGEKEHLFDLARSDSTGRERQQASH